MQPNISVVIPIYNAEAYLVRCINSILSQNFKNFELILVNDGSKDNSLNICNKYAKQDERIIVLNQKNQGASSARKAGIKKSKGKWICFIDADDYIPQNSFYLLYSNTSQEIDIIAGFGEGNGFKNKKTLKIQIYDRYEYLSLLLKEKVVWSLCTKIYRRELFTEYTMSIPNSIVIGEDFLINLKLCLNIRKVKFINKKVYYYDLPEVSASSKHRNKSLDRKYIKMFSNLFFEIIRRFDKKDVSQFALLVYLFNRKKNRLKMRIRNVINLFKQFVVDVK